MIRFAEGLGRDLVAPAALASRVLPSFRISRMKIHEGNLEDMMQQSSSGHSIPLSLWTTSKSVHNVSSRKSVRNYRTLLWRRLLKRLRIVSTVVVPSRTSLREPLFLPTHQLSLNASSAVLALSFRNESLRKKCSQFQRIYASATARPQNHQKLSLPLVD